MTVPANQQTNFAIWYSFYRTRIMAAKAGVTAAFHQQGTKMRVGYDGINTAKNSQTIANGVAFNTKRWYTTALRVASGRFLLANQNTLADQSIGLQ